MAAAARATRSPPRSPRAASLLALAAAAAWASVASTLIASRGAAATLTQLQAYDCSRPDAKRAVVDTNALPPCPRDAVPVQQPVDVLVLPVDRPDVVHVYACLVDLTVFIQPCSDLRSGSESERTSNLSAPLTVHAVEALGRDECQLVHSLTRQAGRTIWSVHIRSLDQLVTFSSIKPNSTMEPVTRQPPRCHDSYYAGRDWYSDVLVTVTVTVRLHDFWARVSHKQKSDAVVMPSGKECVFHEGYCAGLPEGEALWDLVADELCGPDGPGGPAATERGLGSFHDGAAHLASLPGDAAKYVLFTTNTDKVAFRLGSATKVCGVKAFAMEPDPFLGGNPFIVIFKTPSGDSTPTTQQPSVQKQSSFFDGFSFAPYFAEMRMGWGIYLREDLDRKTAQLLAAHAECLARRPQLRTQLALARAAADPAAALVAVLFPDAEGLHGVVVGGVLHLKQCVAVNIALRSAPRCYQEVPVLVSGSGVDAFMTYPGMILVAEGREVPCDPLAPPMFHLFPGFWVAFNPDLQTLSAPPSALGPTGEPALPEFKAVAQPAKGSSSGSADLFEYSTNRGIFFNDMTMRALSGGVPANGIQTSRIFSDADWAVISEKTVPDVETSFRRFAVGMSVLLGVAALAVAAKAVAQAVLSRRLLRCVGSSSLGLQALGGLSPGLLVARLLETHGLHGLHGLHGAQRDADDPPELECAIMQTKLRSR